MKGFYYIENSVNEFHSAPTAFFETLEEAKEAIKYCADWFVGRGTGRILFQSTEFKVVERSYIPYGTTEPTTYKAIQQEPPKFICRGVGLDEDGNVIFSDERW